MTTRNDDHGGNHLQRFQTFLDHLADMCAASPRRPELIVVEWNPDPSRPSLAQAMRLARSVATGEPGDRCPSRDSSIVPELREVSAVPDDRQERGHPAGPGQYVLATNMDVLFSDELAGWLARRELRDDGVYRIDRHDVGQTSIPAGLSATKVLEVLRARHVVRVHGRHGTYAWGDPPRIGDPDRLHNHACGDFTLMAHPVGATQKLPGVSPVVDLSRWPSASCGSRRPGSRGFSASRCSLPYRAFARLGGHSGHDQRTAEP